MVKIVRESLWLPADMHVVTTNGVVKHDGSLVMGAACAAQPAFRWPWLPKAAAHEVHRCGTYMRTEGAYSYGFLLIPNPSLSMVVGLLQTKLHWKLPSTLELIEHSITTMNETLERDDEANELKIRMAYPGIGLGGLTRDQVEPLLQQLPDNVTVCYR